MSLHVSFFTIEKIGETMKLKELLTNWALRWIIEKLHFQKYFHYFSGVVKVSCDTGDCVLIVLNRRSTSYMLSWEDIPSFVTVLKQCFETVLKCSVLKQFWNSVLKECSKCQHCQYLSRYVIMESIVNFF